jgi:gliding-associated putative ABC transporter substrate-binding component GldG
MTKFRYWYLVDFLLVFGIGLNLSVILNNYFFRIDLTEEKRYTLSNATKNVLTQLESDVQITIYLDGELPPAFKLMQKRLAEMLVEFQQYSGSRLKFNFIDPKVDLKDPNSQKFVYELVQKGIQPTNILMNEGGKKSEKMIFPGAVIQCKGQEVGFIFLKGALGTSSEGMIDQSIEGLEYEFITRIKDLSKKKRQKIGIVLPSKIEENATEFSEILKARYDVYQLKKNDLVTPLKNLDLIILLKPDSIFSDKQKLALDQYVVNGGKILVFIDKVQVNTNEIGQDTDISFAVETNLDDLFFRWGFRVNNELVQDLQSGAMPIVTGNMGNQANTQLLPWPYYIVATQFGKHEIVKNSGPLILYYANSIDTVKAVGIKKTPLVLSSNYNKVVKAPLKINLETVKKDFDPAAFQNKPKIIALLNEGKFISLYRNRLTKEEASKIEFKEQNKEGKVLVVADANICFNETNKNQILPLGFDKYLNKRFSNADFLQNSLNYLLDSEGIIKTKLKELKYRPLDKLKVKNEKTKWQLINIILPLGLLLLMGIVFVWSRNRKNIIK